jgi:hypothetical protein
MSKGLGRVERRVLEQVDVDQSWLMVGRTVPDLRTALPEIAEPSLRRALRSLERKGLVQHLRGKRGQSCDQWLAVAAVKRQAKREREERRREKAGFRNEQDEKEQEARSKRLLAAILGDGKVDPAAATLAKVLGRLGSAHEGEVLAAALKAEEIRKKTGKTWEQLLGLE